MDSVTRRGLGVAASMETFVSGAARTEVLDDGGDKAIPQIGRQVKLGRFDLLLAVFPCGADGDFAGAAIDEEVDWLRERGAFLNVVIGDELEDAALREDSSFIVDGAVFEMEGQLRSNLAAMGDLHEISGRDDLAIFRTQLEKAMNGSPRIANGHGVCLSAELAGAEKQDN